MQTLKSTLTKSKKLSLESLIKIMNEGLRECKTELEAKEFGLEVMAKYDYLHDTELKKYMLGDPVFGKYYRNLIFRNDLFTMKNLYWYPKSITAVHGHAKSDCWVIWTHGELVERVYKVCKYFLFDIKSLIIIKI